MAIISYGHTDIGLKRKTNQDSIVTVKNHNLFCVADGMGGHNGGDIASQLSVKHFPELLEANKDKDPKELLTYCIKEINNKIHSKAAENELLKGMGTTIVTSYFKGPNAYIANVGDSRCYLVNNGKLYQITRDHSFVQEKLNMGIYGREQAKDDKQKNIITRTVGFEPEVDVDVYTYKVCKNDIFFVCSDGLHGKVSDADLIHLVNKFIPQPANATEDDLKSLVHALIDQANLNGGQDNISVIVQVAQ